MADIVDLSRRILTCHTRNSSKVAMLFFIASGCWLILDLFGIRDLTSPWFAAPLVPIAAIYIMERSGRIHWFKGMTLPSLYVLASMVAFVWALKTNSPPSTALTYVALGGFITAFSFLMLRIFTYHPCDRNVR